MLRQEDAGVVFALGDADKSDRGVWILESGTSRNLVSDAQLLVEVRVCNDEIAMAEGESLQLT